MIEDWSDLMKAIDLVPTEQRMYRGVPNASYELIPKVGRPRVKPYSIDAEYTLLTIFMQRAIAYVAQPPRIKLEWLALAQHHGLPTRLLDWSYSPLVAVFFAVEDDEDASDGAVYACNIPDEKDKFDPFKIDKIRKYYPPHFSPRIPAQRGLFTVHPRPQEPMSTASYKIEKIGIPGKLKREFRNKLHVYGFNRESLFPGLDGCCDHLAWSFRQGIGYWT
jgi:hypothetical protein